MEVVWIWAFYLSGIQSPIYFSKYDVPSYPQSSLIQANNGKLYGTAGGNNTGGVIFEWDPLTDTLAIKIDLYPKYYGAGFYGSMMQAINGKIYGLYWLGNGSGVLFEWDPVTNIYIEKEDTITGINSYCDGLVQTNYSTSDTIIAEAFESYTSPSGRNTWFTSGVYIDTIPNTAGCDSIITVNLTINNFTGQEARPFRSGITIYPNPTDGLFTIDLGRSSPNAEIIISQLDGRVIIKDFIINSRFKDLHLSGSPGLYVVSVISGNERTVFKLSKK